MFNSLLSRLKKPMRLSEAAARDWVREHQCPEELAAEIKKLSGWDWLYPERIEALGREYTLQCKVESVLEFSNASDGYYLVADAVGLGLASGLLEAGDGKHRIAILLPEHWEALNAGLKGVKPANHAAPTLATADEGIGDIGEKVDNLLASCELSGATDLHLSPERHTMVARYRKDGRLLEHSRYTWEQGQAICRAIRQRAGLSIGVLRRPVDGALQFGGQELRLAATSCLTGESLTVRWPGKKLCFDHPGQLGMNTHLISTIQRYTEERRSGWVVVSGGIGAGKTTTLYALLRHLGTGKRILTLEDPVEALEPAWTQVEMSGIEPGRRKEVLRASLRQSPDWFMLGELRDKEGADLARAAMATGHMVWTTLHLVSPVMLNARLESLEISRRELQPYSLLHIHQNWQNKGAGSTRTVEFALSLVESG